MTVKEYNKSVEEFADAVYRFIAGHFKDTARACDIVQDSYEKLWRHVAEIDYAVVKSWLFTTAYNQMIDIIRKESKMIHAGKYDDAALFYDVSYNDLAEILDKALARLPHQLKSVIMLRDYEGYSYREISSITGMTEAQVKINIYRGRMELRKFIGSIEKVV